MAEGLVTRVYSAELGLLVFDTDLFLYYISSPESFSDEWAEPDMVDEIVLVVDRRGFRYDVSSTEMPVRSSGAPLSMNALEWLVRHHFTTFESGFPVMDKSLDELVQHMASEG